MKKRSLMIFVCSVLSLFAPAAFATSDLDQAAIQRGQKKALSCAACHGANGVSVNPLWPNLAGQKKDYLKKQIMDFKAGARKDPLMSPMAAAIADADVDDLVAYFSSL